MAENPYLQLANAPQDQDEGNPYLALASAPKPFQPSLGGQRVVPDVLRPLAKTLPVQAPAAKPTPMALNQGDALGAAEVNPPASAFAPEKDDRDLLRLMVAPVQGIIHGTAGLAANATTLLGKMEGKYPTFTRLLHLSNPALSLGLEAAGKVAATPKAQEIAQDVKDWNVNARKAEDQFLLDRLKVSKDTPLGQTAQAAGEVAGTLIKASVLGPAAVPYFAAEGGIDKATAALDQHKPLGKALAAGAVSTLTAATLMSLGGETAYDSLLKLAAAKAAKGTALGLGFGAADLAVDRYLLDQNLAPEDAGKALLGSVKTMLGYELAGFIPEAKLVLGAKRVTGEYASPDDARAVLAPRLADAYASGNQARADALYGQMQAVAYAEKAGTEFTGKKASPKAPDVSAARQVADVAKTTNEEVQDALKAGPVQGVDQREYPAGDQGGQAPGPGPGDRPAQGGPAPQEEGPAQAVAAPVADAGHPAHARDVFPAPDAPEGAPSPEIPDPERQKAGLDPTPDQTVPEKLQDVPGIRVAGDVFTLPTSSLYADPVRFQYKKQNETTGVRQVDAKTGASGALHGVKVWNEQSAGVLDVWRDPADGKVYVVNGHNRYGKALDLNVPSLKVRFIDVPDAKSALIFGARKNLAEGNGTVLDAATYFRESGATVKDLEAQGIPVDKGIVKDGLALAGLPDTWFEAAANDPEILRLAVETGKAGLKGKQADTTFKELHDLLARRGGDAGEISSSYWKDLVDRIKGTQDLHTGEVNMFGEEETTSTLAEQTDLIRHIQGKLGAEKQAGTVLTGKRYSEAVGKAATVDAAGAGTMKAEANQALAHFKQQKNLTGIGDIINEHAARLAQAGSAKEADAIRSDALEAVREQIRQDLAGGEQADRPGSGAVDSGGAPSLFGEETGDGQVKPAGEVKPEPTARAKKQLPPKKGESTPAETREAYKAPVQAVITDPAARAAIYKDPEVQDVIAQISEPETDPFVASRGAVGARKQVKVPGGEKGRNILARAANHIIESMKDTVGDPLRPLTRGAQGTAQKNIAQALADHGQLQMLQGKDGALPDLAHSMIEPTLPEGPDLKAGAVSQYALSPHNLGPLARAFTVDRLKASLDRLMKQAAGTFWARDVMEGTPDASAYVQRAMSPIAKDILKTDAAIRPLDTARRKAQADVLRARRKAVRVETDKAEQALIRASLAKGGKGDRREDAKLTEDQLRAAMDKAESAPAVQSAKRALADFDQKNQAKFSALLEQRAGHYEKAKAQIQALAAKHADVRVSLLVDAGDVVPAWLKEIAKPEDIKTANRITEGMEKYRDALKERGIPVIDDPYLTWLLKPLDPERFADQSTPEGQTRIRQLLAFQHRQGSINLFPTAHGSLAAYIPTVSRKLADQPLLNKWSSNPYAQEANPLHAPKFGQWLGKTLGEMQNPKRAEVIDSVINAAKKLDILRDIAFSPRVAVKHLVKMGNLVGLHHSWLLPAAKDVALHYAQQAENLPLVRTAMKAMGVDPHRNDLTQALAATLMATKQVSRMLYEDPMVAEHETPILNKFVDPTARGMVMKANALGSKAINLGGYPVTAVEALENFTNIFASMRQGQAAGLKPMANIDATLLNILDYNYRSGPDAARYLKDRVMNTAFRFTMTPAKTLELQTKIIQKGLSGERDIYGSLETAHLIRHMVVIGTMLALAKKHGHDIMDDVARLPLVSKDWVKHMALSVYHMAQGHKEKADKNLKMAAGALGGAVQTSPTLGGSTDIYALAMAAKDHSLKPLLSTVSAVKQAKALFGKGAPRGYKDKAHYLTNSPTPGEEARREKMSEQKGAKILGPFKRAEREP